VCLDYGALIDKGQRVHSATAKQSTIKPPFSRT
jgi:hypothetical protein